MVVERANNLSRLQESNSLSWQIILVRSFRCHFAGTHGQVRSFVKIKRFFKCRECCGHTLCIAQRILKCGQLVCQTLCGFVMNKENGGRVKRYFELSLKTFFDSWRPRSFVRNFLSNVVGGNA